MKLPDIKKYFPKRKTVIRKPKPVNTTMDENRIKREDAYRERIGRVNPRLRRATKRRSLRG